jgi:hypothetical protein
MDILTKCLKAHSNFLPKFHFSIWHKHNFVDVDKSLEAFVYIFGENLRHCLNKTTPSSSMNRPYIDCEIAARDADRFIRRDFSRQEFQKRYYAGSPNALSPNDVSPKSPK